jgi:hypothetical protein
MVSGTMTVTNGGDGSGQVDGRLVACSRVDPGHVKVVCNCNTGGLAL